jgi:Helix-turn-helix domain
MTQCEMVLAHLKKGRILTSMQAFRLYGITRLADRVRDLRAKGHRVECGMVKLPSGKRTGVFSL